MDKRGGRYRLHLAVVSLALLVAASTSGVLPYASVIAGDPSALPQSPTPSAQAIDLTRRPRVKFSGWIGAATADRWSIGNHVLHVDPGSTLTDPVQPGRFVTVIARVDDQGQLHAESVSAQLPSGGTGYTTEFRCLIQEIDTRYWIVCDHIVLITENTSIQGRPVLGALAEVKGIRLTGDTVLAKSIKVTVPGAFAEVEFEGPIESLTEHVWTVSGNTVTVSPVTVVRGTPELGLLAEVKGTLQPDGSVLAITITVKGPGSTSQLDVQGLVERIETSYWMVAGTRIFIDSNTFIDDSRATADVGMWAQIRALRRQDRSLLALRIRLSRPD